jgi:hypothetical protein
MGDSRRTTVKLTIRRLLDQWKLPGKGWVALAAVGITLSCWAALTTVNQAAIENSTLDASVIGSKIPAAATFTTTHVTSGPSSFSSQGFYQGWNRNVLGETDLYNSPGLGIGGFYFYNGATPNLLMSLNNAGVLTPIGGFVGNLTGNVVGNTQGVHTGTVNGTLNGTVNGSAYGATGAFGNLIAACSGCGQTPWNPGTYSSGTWFGWNQNGGSTGESDIINRYVAGEQGGFSWWSTTAAALSAPVMTLTPAGVLTVNQINANVNGNVSTATKLQSSPSNCAAGQATPGVNAYGQSQNCETAIYSQRGTVQFTAATFPNTATTYITENFAIAAAPIAGAVVTCTPQGDFGSEVQYTCWMSGARLYIKVTHGTVGLPYTVQATDVNYLVQQ